MVKSIIGRVEKNQIHGGLRIIRVLGSLFFEGVVPLGCGRFFMTLFVFVQIRRLLPVHSLFLVRDSI